MSKSISPQTTRMRLIKLILLGVILTLFNRPQTTLAQPAAASTICYAIADNQGKLPGNGTANNEDQFLQIDPLTGATTLVGATHTLNVEALTFVSSGAANRLYAVDGGTLGTVDIETGAFTPIGAAGSGNGALGKINFNVIIGLAYDQQNDTLYATQSKVGKNAILLQIDRQTGAYVPNAFGSGQDYAVIPTVLIDGEPAQNVDDLAFDPTSGLLYAPVNVKGAHGKLIILDPATAAVTELGVFRNPATGATVDNLEGLGFDATGQLYATGGNHGPHRHDNNKLWRIDKETAAATEVGPFTPGPVDIESFGCLTVAPMAPPTDTPPMDPPTQTPTDTPTPITTPTPADTPTPTMTPTDTPTATMTPADTPTATMTPTATPQTSTLIGTNVSTPIATNTATPPATTTMDLPTGLEPVKELNTLQMQYLPLIVR